MIYLRISILSMIILLGGVFFPTGISAQDVDTRIPDFNYVKNFNPWLTSGNASGLYKIPVDNISVGELYFTKTDGDFRNYHQSNDSYEYGLYTESYCKVNQKVTLYGMVNYANFEGKNMSGSVFINPYNNPFDIVEVNEDNRGTKQREKYNLIGAVNAEIYKGLKVGGKIDYKAENYAKLKDLRHKNTLLDMSVAPGISYQLNPTIELGANYLYQRRLESVEFRMYGNTDRQYVSMVNYGAFFGTTELFGETGYTTENTSHPLFYESHGASLQIDLRLSSQIQFFNSFSFQSGDGYYGKRSSTSITYSGHSSNSWGYEGNISLTKPQSLHIIRLKANNENLENNQNIYRRETSPSSGTTQIVHYGKTKMLDQQVFTSGIEYIGNWGIKNFQPEWIVKLAANFYSRSQTVSIYPYYRKQSIQATDIRLFANKNIFSGKNTFGIFMSTSYGFGQGTRNDDNVYATPSSEQNKPYSNDYYLYREYEYLTASRAKIEAGFRYTKALEKIAVFGELAFSQTKAFDIKYLDGDQNRTLYIKIGSNF